MLPKIAMIFTGLILLVGILIFRPVPIVKEEYAIVETGTVTRVTSNAGNDVVFRVKERPRKYYINRGLENGLKLSELQKLIGQKVVMKYPKYWTPLDWNDEIKHLSKLEHKGQVLFNELK